MDIGSWYLSYCTMLEFGLRPLEVDIDTSQMADLGSRFRVLDEYVEHLDVSPLLADLGIDVVTRAPRHWQGSFLAQDIDFRA